MLCLAYTASLGKRTLAAVDHELKVWRAEGVETGEQADAHLKLLAGAPQSRAIRLRSAGSDRGRADPGRAQGHRTLVRSIRLRRCHGAGGRHPGRAKERPVVLEQHPQDLERQGAAHDPRCAGAGACSWRQPEHPCRPDDPQRQRLFEHTCPPTFAEKAAGLIFPHTIRRLYAYQKRIVPGCTAHRSGAASDRPCAGPGCPRPGRSC